MCASPRALADLARDHQIIVAHGNGPQVGLMALQAASLAPGNPWPLDILGAETEGMIGYLIEQELMNALPPGTDCATLLTRVEVDPQDPAFDQPTKPIGPVYAPAEEAKLSAPNICWSMVEEPRADCAASCPRPCPWRFWASRHPPAGRGGVCVICAGGGGIPVVRRQGRHYGRGRGGDRQGPHRGLAGAAWKADVLLMLTDVEAVFRDWGGPDQAAISTITPDALDDAICQRLDGAENHRGLRFRAGGRHGGRDRPLAGRAFDRRRTHGNAGDGWR
jgi:carbamate kinase